MLSIRQWDSLALTAHHVQRRTALGEAGAAFPLVLSGRGAGQGSSVHYPYSPLLLPILREMAISSHRATLLLHRTRQECEFGRGTQQVDAMETKTSLLAASSVSTESDVPHVQVKTSSRLKRLP